MRSLDECKAEIFRRVEDRKKERRKKRSRMLIVSISLAICFTVFLSVHILFATSYWVILFLSINSLNRNATAC